MSSDDRWGDEPDRYGVPEPDNAIARARRKVKGPAIGLIVVGIITLILGAVSAVNFAGGGVKDQLDAGFAEQERQIDANPQMPAQQKQDMKELFAKIKEWTTVVIPVFIGLYALCGLVVAFGGVRLWTLSGRRLPTFAAVLSMIPCCVSYTCVLGLPIGIWALVVMSNPGVKAAFAAARRPPDTLENEGERWN